MKSVDHAAASGRFRRQWLLWAGIPLGIAALYCGAYFLFLRTPELPFRSSPWNPLVMFGLTTPNYQDYFRAGYLQLRERRPATAAAQFLAAAELFRNNPRIHANFLGRAAYAWYQANRPDEAKKCLAAMVAGEGLKDRSFLLTDAARITAQCRRFTESGEYLNELLKSQDPSSQIDAYAQLASNAEALRNYDEALKNYDLAIKTAEAKITTTYRFYGYNGRKYELSKNQLLLRLLWDKAGYCFRQKNYTVALKAIEQAEALTGQDKKLLAENYYFRGRCQSGLQATRAAADKYERCIEYAGQAHPVVAAYAAYYLGMCRYKEGDFAAAAAAYRKVGDIGRQNPLNRYFADNGRPVVYRAFAGLRLGQSLLQLKDRDGAKAAFNNLLADQDIVDNAASVAADARRELAKLQ